MTYIKPQRSFVFPLNFQGFTLLELLVALAIFAVIAVMAYSGLSTILTTRLQTDQHAAQLAQLQTTFLWLRRDIEQHVARPIRDQYGDRQVALIGTISFLELTRAGWRNPAQQKRSSLQRIAYHLEDNTLWRSYWRMLDRAQDAQPQKMELLNEVNEIQLRYLDESRHWHEQWPLENLLTNVADENVSLPMLKAIEVTLTVVGWGNITRLFRVPNQINIKPLKIDN